MFITLKVSVYVCTGVYIYIGFSFGGMLACCNAARLWKETCIGVDVLEKNVICITFGQPLVAIPYVQETIKKYAKFENTIHSICDQEDIFPKLLRNNYGYYPKLEVRGSSLRALTSGNGGTSPMMPRSLSSESSHLSDVGIIL